jgi:predicted alpha/beta hydrolase
MATRSPPIASIRTGPDAGAGGIAAAMAVPQAFYSHFARWLARRGYVVWTFDYRGIGESLTGPRRRLKADLSDWLHKDYDALLRHIAAAAPGQPLFVVGHSFGGQVAPLLPSRERLAGLVNIAVGSGSTRHLTTRMRRSAPLLWHVLAPTLCPLFGYFPGARIGVVGDLPTGALMQWRRWCLTPGVPAERRARCARGLCHGHLSGAGTELCRRRTAA